jgi:hypothetical protein
MSDRSSLICIGQQKAYDAPTLESMKLRSKHVQKGAQC